MGAGQRRPIDGVGHLVRIGLAEEAQRDVPLLGHDEANAALVLAVEGCQLLDHDRRRPHRDEQPGDHPVIAPCTAWNWRRASSMSHGRSSRTRAPLTARRVEEVAAVHVQGAGQTLPWIGDRVDHVVSEDKHVPLDELRAAAVDQCASARRAASVEGIVLLAAVDADHRPHPMVVGEQRHVRRPHDV